MIHKRLEFGWWVLMGLGLFCGILQSSWAENGRIEISQASLSNASYTIRSSGSYVLTESLWVTNNQNGITIAASNVTLDLNGFTLYVSTNSTRYGITSASNYRGLVVKNGLIKGWSVGVYLLGDAQRVEEVIVQGGSLGIYCGGGSIVRNCKVMDTTSSGIMSGGLILNCEVTQTTNAFSYGIYPHNSSGSLISGCSVDGSQNGMQINGPHYVFGNTITRTSGLAVYASSGISGTRIDRNVANRCAQFIYFSAGTNVSFCNRGVNIRLGGGGGCASVCGPEVVVSGVITNTSPWADFYTVTP